MLKQDVYESFAKGESEHLEEQQIATASTGEEVLETRFARESLGIPRSGQSGADSQIWDDGSACASSGNA